LFREKAARRSPIGRGDQLGSVPRSLRLQFYSRYRERPVRMITMRPPGRSRPLPVVLVLHGAGDDAARAVSLG